MASIPSRRVLSSGAVEGGRVSQDIADTGQGLKARALGDIGKGISDVGNVLLQIELEKSAARDESSVATAIAGENELVLGELNRIASTSYGSVEDIQADSDALDGLIKRNRESAVKGMSDNAKRAFTNRSVVSESAKQSQFTNALFKRELSLGKQVASEKLSTSYGVLLNPNASLAQRELATESLEAVRIGYSRYFDEGELADLEERTKVSSLVAAERFEEAGDVIDNSKVFTAEEKEEQTKSANSAKTSAMTRNRLIYEDAATKVEVDWLQAYKSGTLTSNDVESWQSGSASPESIKSQEVLKANWITKLQTPPGVDFASDIYTAWVTKVDLDPSSTVTDTETNDQMSLREAIYAQVGGDRTVNLSVKEAESLVTKLEGNISSLNTQNTANHSNAQRLLKSQYAAGLHGKVGKKSVKEEESKNALKITQFSNDHPTASKKDWADFQSSLFESIKKPFPFSNLISGLKEFTSASPTGVQRRIGTRDKALQSIPADVPEVTSFDIGNTRRAPNGTNYIMIKKGSNPAEDEWLPIQ